jgi:hypothetical protein
LAGELRIRGRSRQSLNMNSLLEAAQARVWRELRLLKGERFRRFNANEDKPHHHFGLHRACGILMFGSRFKSQR